MNIWQIMCCAYIVLSAISLFIVLARCAAAGRADDIEEARDGTRRS